MPWVTKMKTTEINKITLKDNNNIAQIIWCNVDQSWLKIFNITLADSTFEITDKSIACDSNQPNFRLALSIQCLYHTSHNTSN